MHRLGEVVGTAQGLVIVRSSDSAAPDFGVEAIDETLTAVGRVVDVFGPVERPYVAITPHPDVDASPASLLGRRLYAR